MYGTQTSVLATTGFAGMTLFGLQFGVVQLMIAALLLLIAGVALFRLGTRGAKYAGPDSDGS